MYDTETLIPKNRGNENMKKVMGLIFTAAAAFANPAMADAGNANTADGHTAHRSHVTYYPNGIIETISPIINQATPTRDGAIFVVAGPDGSEAIAATQLIDQPTSSSPYVRITLLPGQALDAFFSSNLSLTFPCDADPVNHAGLRVIGDIKEGRMLYANLPHHGRGVTNAARAAANASMIWSATVDKTAYACARGAYPSHALKL